MIEKIRFVKEMYGTFETAHDVARTAEKHRNIIGDKLHDLLNEILPAGTIVISPESDHQEKIVTLYEAEIVEWTDSWNSIHNPEAIIRFAHDSPSGTPTKDRVSVNDLFNWSTYLEWARLGSYTIKNNTRFSSQEELWAHKK